MRPCRHPGCCVLVPGGYCAEHQPSRPDRRSADSAAWHKLYKLPVWTRELRPGQLLREPYCRACAQQGRRIRATEVDHIRPHRGDMTLFTDRDNLQSLCHSCHSRKTLAEMRKK